MKTLLYKIFIKNWSRKIISLILAIITWSLVNQSLTINKTIYNVPIQITNLPPKKTIAGLKKNGFLNKTITLTFYGKKSVLEKLHSYNIKVVIDATGKGEEWVLGITTKNIVCQNPKINIEKGLDKVVHPHMIIKLQPSK